MNPLLVPCEGSGWPTHHTAAGNGVCAMCGHLVAVCGDGDALDHDRSDILAMIDRGDFDSAGKTVR